MDKILAKTLSGLAFGLIGGLTPLYFVLAWDASGQIINNTANATATNTNWIDINNSNVVRQDVRQDNNLREEPRESVDRREPIYNKHGSGAGGDGSWWQGTGPNNMDGNGNWMNYDPNYNSENTGLESGGDWWNGGSLDWENQPDIGWWNNYGADNANENSSPTGNWMDYMNDPGNWANDSSYAGGIGTPFDYTSYNGYNNGYDNRYNNGNDNGDNGNYYDNNYDNNNYYDQADYQPSYQPNYQRNNRPNYNNYSYRAPRGRVTETFNDLRGKMVDKFQDEASSMIRDFGRHKNNEKETVISGNHINVTY